MTGVVVEVRRERQVLLRRVRCSHAKAELVTYQPREGGAVVRSWVCDCGARWRSDA